MQNEKLQATLIELEQALQAAGEMDDATRQRLQRAVADVRHAILEKETSAEERSSLAARLTKAVGDFEGSHPTLVSIIGRLADGLAQIGI